MTTITTDPIPSADDICGVCAETRENHGDKRHQFSIDGVLIALKPAPMPKNLAPTPRGQVVGNDPVARMVLRMVERLIAKGVLEGDDLVHIFGGERSEDSGRETPPLS